MLTDEQLVEKARALLADRKKLCWYRLGCGVALLGTCVYLVVEVVQKLEKQDSAEMTIGFFTGIALAFLCGITGLVGAVLLAQSRSGFHGEMRSRELLVTYHDRLRDLRALPEDSISEKPHNVGPGSPKPSTPG